MTITTFLTSNKRNMDCFENPQNKSLEELKIKYISNDGSYEELIPALNLRWRNKDYIFTLYTSPPMKNSDGHFPMGSKEDWLERMTLLIADVDVLLQLQYHRFWSEVVYNEHSLDGLNSFLQNAFPFYLEDLIPQDKEILKVYKQVHSSIFILLMRLTRSKESERAWIKSTTLGDILYDKFIISLPQIMEICLIYANDNLKEVMVIINEIIDIQPKYMSDIEKSTSFMYEVFTRFEDHLSSITEMDGKPVLMKNCRGAISSVEIEKLISLVLDISCSLDTILEVCPRVGRVFHQQQLEQRIAKFYGATIPVLFRFLDLLLNSEDTLGKFKHLQLKLNLSRHHLISAVYKCLTSYLSSILESRENLSEDELKNRVENYINTLTDSLSDHVFMRDYNSAFPIQRELKILFEIFPGLDSLKCEFLIESVISLYDLPSKKQNNVKTTIQVDPGPSSSNAIHTSEPQQQKYSSKKVAGVELESLITEVKDILPHLGNGFVAKCLEHFSYVSADVINACLEGILPDSLSCLDQEMPSTSQENTKENAFSERINIYDNDEFDIMTQDTVDTTRIHRGKRPEKHKNLFEMLDDKTHVNQLRDLYTQLSLVEHFEDKNEYEDEYDDTYDDLDMSVGNEGETETEERRPFVIPRVLQQQSYVKDASEYKPEEEIDEDGGVNNEERGDIFIENPADIRERAEQRRQELRDRGGRTGRPHHNVVGKPKGQGQEKDVVRSREVKNSNKAFQGNHNRRSMAAKKRRQGMLPS